MMSGGQDDVSEAATAVLAMLSTWSGSHNRIMDAGCLQRIAEVLEHRSAETVVHACAALTNLSSKEPMRQRVCDSSVVPLLIGWALCDDASVVEEATSTFANLSLSESFRADETLCTLLVRSLVSLLVARTEGGILTQVCACLVNLTVAPQCVEELKASPGGCWCFAF